MTLRPPSETPWRFLFHCVLGLDCLRGKRFVAPESEPDPRWSGFTHLVEAFVETNGRSITVTQSFQRGTKQLALRFPFSVQKSRSHSPLLLLGGPTASPLTIACSRSYSLDLRPNGRLWMLGRTTISSALPSSWSSCLVLEGALELENPPYVSQVVRFDAPLSRNPVNAQPPVRPLVIPPESPRVVKSPPNSSRKEDQ